MRKLKTEIMLTLKIKKMPDADIKKKRIYEKLLL